MEKNLKVLMIGTDRKLFEEGSAVSERIKEQGKGISELHIVVMSDRKHKLSEKKLAENVFLYPTNSFLKLLRPLDAVSLGKKLIKEKKFVRGESLITTQDPFECGWAGLRVKKKWRIPLEVQLHTDPFSSQFSGFLNAIRKHLARKVLPQADHIRVVSEFLKNSILQNSKFKILNSSAISVLPVYIERREVEDAQISFDLHARHGWSFIILCVARLEPEKNLELAIKILSLVRNRFPNTGLVFVGSGSEENKLKKLVRELRQEKNVAFAGWQDDMASYYKTANIFLQTSLFEGYGMALVEAGLSGLPVVTTPVGIALELEHGRDCLIYPSGNPELFAEGIVDLIEHNQKRENLRENLRNTLNSKLLSKEEYIKQLQSNWVKIATSISK